MAGGRVPGKGKYILSLKGVGVGDSSFPDLLSRTLGD